MTAPTLPANPDGQHLAVNHTVTVAEASRYLPGSGRPVRTVCGVLVWPTTAALGLPPCRDCQEVGRG